MLMQKQVTDDSLVLKDSDMESENFSSLIQISVSDGQKTDSSKVVSFIGIHIIINTKYQGLMVQKGRFLDVFPI